MDKSVGCSAPLPQSNKKNNLKYSRLEYLSSIQTTRKFTLPGCPITRGTLLEFLREPHYHPHMRTSVGSFPSHLGKERCFCTSVSLHLFKAPFSLNPDNLKFHCFLCSSLFCSLDQ